MMKSTLHIRVVVCALGIGACLTAGGAPFEGLEDIGDVLAGIPEMLMTGYGEAGAFPLAHQGGSVAITVPLLRLEPTGSPGFGQFGLPLGFDGYLTVSDSDPEPSSHAWAQHSLSLFLDDLIPLNSQGRADSSTPDLGTLGTESEVALGRLPFGDDVLDAGPQSLELPPPDEIAEILEDWLDLPEGGPGPELPPDIERYVLTASAAAAERVDQYILVPVDPDPAEPVPEEIEVDFSFEVDGAITADTTGLGEVPPEGGELEFLPSLGASGMALGVLMLSAESMNGWGGAVGYGELGGAEPFFGCIGFDPADFTPLENGYDHDLDYEFSMMLPVGEPFILAFGMVTGSVAGIDVLDPLATAAAAAMYGDTAVFSFVAPDGFDIDIIIPEPGSFLFLTALFACFPGRRQAM